MVINDDDDFGYHKRKERIYIVIILHVFNCGKQTGLIGVNHKCYQNP